jgi:hypothetical protein
MLASDSPTLNEAWTVPAGRKAESPGPRTRFVPVDPLLDLPGDHVDHLFLVGMVVESRGPCPAPESR